MAVTDRLLDNARRDADLLAKNRARGDDSTKPRTVDFLLIAEDAAKASLIRDFIIDCRFGDATLETVEGQFRILVRVHMPTTQPVLGSVSGLMECLAALFGVHYDGWGSVLQTT
jgi:hypothetical protein